MKSFQRQCVSIEVKKKKKKKNCRCLNIWGRGHRLSKGPPSHCNNIPWFCLLRCGSSTTMSQAQERCHITVSQPINLHKLGTWQWSQELLWIHDSAIATGGTRSVTLMFTLPIQRVFAPTLTATKKRHLKVQFPEQRKNPYTWKFSYKFTGGRGSDPHRERRWQENAPEGALWCPQLTDVLVNLAHHPILSPSPPSSM